MFRGEEASLGGREVSAGMRGTNGGERPVVVLGMHRSGTSVTTGLLARLGCALPATLMDSGPSNPLGHWESAAITTFDERLLDTLHSSWDDWSALDFDAIPADAMTAFVDEAAALLASEFSQGGQFCLKDPRMCRLAPVWLPALERANADAVFVLPFRNPAEVAASLAKRDGMQLTDGLLLWLRHMLEAECATRGRTRAVLSFDRLLSNWRGVACELEARLGIDWPREDWQTAGDIDAFVLAEHRHHALGLGALSCAEPLRGWIGACVGIFERWERSGEDAGDHPVLDGVRGDFDRWTVLASAVLGPYRAALSRERAALVRERTARLAAEAAAQALTARQERMTSGIVRAFDRLPRAVSRRISAHLVERTILDAPWYLANNADVAQQGMSAAQHYARFGFDEGRQPSLLPKLP